MEISSFALATVGFVTHVEAEHINSSGLHPAVFWEEIPTLTFCIDLVEFMLVPNWTQGGTEVPQILPWDLSISTISNSSKGQEALALQEENIFFPRSWQTHPHGGMVEIRKHHPQLVFTPAPIRFHCHSTPQWGLKHHVKWPSLPTSQPLCPSLCPSFLFSLINSISHHAFLEKLQ